MFGYNSDSDDEVMFATGISILAARHRNWIGSQWLLIQPRMEAMQGSWHGLEKGVPPIPMDQPESSSFSSIFLAM
jgi:hypothetical protein